MERRASLQLASASLLLGLGLAALPTQAGNDSWSVAGSPAGGSVTKVVVNPTNSSILYAASGPGVFESTDAGADWTLVFPTLNTPTDIAIDPQNPQTLYAAYDGDATKTLFKSTDGGATWAEMDNGIGKVQGGTELDSVGEIAVDPVNEGVVYAAAVNTGVYKSTDGGAHWAAINTGISHLSSSDVFITQLLVDPVTPNVLYLNSTMYSLPGTTPNPALMGVYTSVDSGAHWTATGWTGSPLDALTIDPTDHTHLIGYTPGGGTAADGLESSTDSGSSWSAPISSPFAVSSITIDPSNSQHLIVGTDESGLYQTANGGTTWTQVPGATSPMQVWAVTFDPTNSANVYASIINWGLFKSADGGSTWSGSGNGIHNVVPDLMLEGKDEVLYLATAGSGVYKSPDQGVTWTEVGGSVPGSLPAQGDTVYALVEDPTTNSTLYAGSVGGLYKTIDGGDTWTESDTGIAAHAYILALAIDPENVSTLYAGTPQLGVFKSVDGGASWTSASSGIPINGVNDVLALTVDPADSNTVYAGTYSTGLFKSVDGGATWKADTAGIPVTDVWAVAVDPSNHDVVYASTTAGMYKSTDAGASWTVSDTGLNGYIMTNIQIDPNNTADIYVSPRYGIGDAYVSADAGATWNPLTNGLSAAAAAVKRSSSVRTARERSIKGMTAGASGIAASISSVAVDPMHSTQVFGVGNDGQVYIYNDLNPPTGSSGNGSGGTGPGSTGGGGTTSSGSVGGSGGGGSLGLLGLGLLTGLFARRRSTRRA